MSVGITNRGEVTAHLLLPFTIAAVGLFQGGLLKVTPDLIAVVSGALLVFGLPHGSFDIALLRRAGGAALNRGALVALVALYLLAAGTMYLIWRLAPLAALAAFFAMAIVHFAEDWRACRSRFIAVGIAAAIVSAPALLHRETLIDLFTLLTGDPRSAMLGHLLLLIAPTAIAVAVVGAIILYQSRQKAMAVALCCAISAMIFLPPVVGFALFFCLVHSPAQFAQHADELGLHRFSQWRGEVIPLTIGGIGVAVAIFLLNSDAPISANLFSSSFMTLAVLTVPHMVVPAIVGRLRPPPLLVTA